MDKPTYYAVLGVSPAASQEVIKAAYRAIMKANHPDLVAETEETSARARAAAAAYEVLSDVQRRAAYDKSLTSPPEPVRDVEDEVFVDDWGEAQEWDLSPPPPPSPNLAPPPGAPTSREAAGPALPGWPPPQPEPGEVRLLAPAQAVGPALVLAGVALVALLVLAASRVEGPEVLASGQSRCVAVLIGMLLGAVAAAVGRVRSVGLAVAAVLVGSVVVTVELVSPADLLSAARVLSAAFVGAVATGMVLGALRRQRQVDQVVRRSSLRSNNLFGTLPGGVAADLLDSDLSVLGDLHAARMMRCSQAARPFSHMVVCGNRVGYLIAVVGPPGAYRWSGPSLLATVPGQRYPVEMFRCDYARVMAGLRETLGSDTQVRGWVVVYPSAPGVVAGEAMGSHPTVTGADDALAQVKGFLSVDNDLGTVDQARFVDAGVLLFG